MNSHFAKATRDTYELKIMNIRASLYLILHSFLPLLFTKKYCSIETFLLNKKRSGVIPEYAKPIDNRSPDRGLTAFRGRNFYLYKYDNRNN